jgi:hypothetical protein
VSDIALILNQHLTALRLVERALHDSDGWTFRMGEHAANVQVTVSDFGVSFWGLLPAPGATVVAIDVLHRDELVWARVVEVPDPAGRMEINGLH